MNTGDIAKQTASFLLTFRSTLTFYRQKSTVHPAACRFFRVIG